MYLIRIVLITMLGSLIFTPIFLVANGYYMEDRKKMRIFLNCLAISILLVTITFAFAQLPTSRESTEVTGMVISKKYEEASSNLVPIRMGKTTTYVTRHSPEKFMVTLTYQGVTDVIYNQDLYNSVDEGDWVNVYLITSYDNNHRIIQQELSLLNE